MVGAHTLNYNTGSCGIVLLGDFTKTPPSDASLTAAMRVLAWKAGQKGIDVSAADQFTNFAGQTSEFPNITGHRDLGITECPGTSFYSRLGSIRRGVRYHAAGLIGTACCRRTARDRSVAFDPATRRASGLPRIVITSAQDATATGRRR